MIDDETKDIVHINLRLPRALHAALVAEAKREDRSLQRTIVRVLAAAVTTPPDDKHVTPNPLT